MPWYRSWWIRGPLLTLVVLYTGMQTLSPDFWIAYPIVVRLLAGIAAGLLVLGFWAFVLWVARRVLRVPRRYVVVLTCFPVIFIGLLSGMGSGIRRYEQHPNSPGILASSEGEAASDPAPDSELVARRVNFRIWSLGYLHAFDQYLTVSHALRGWEKASDGATLHLELLSRIRSLARRELRTAEGISPTEDTRVATSRMVDASRALGQCVDLTEQVARRADTLSTAKIQSESDRIDQRCQRAVVLLKQSGRAADAIYNELGGHDAFPGFTDQILRITRRSGSTAGLG